MIAEGHYDDDVNNNSASSEMSRALVHKGLQGASCSIALQKKVTESELEAKGTSCKGEVQNSLDSRPRCGVDWALR